MIKKFMNVKVYDGDLIGWTEGTLIEEYPGGRWLIFTKENSSLIRYIKEDTNSKKDGCGYIIPSMHCHCCGSYNIDEESNICYDCDCELKTA